MSHTHHTCNCPHSSVKYCSHCYTCYCLDCGMEWRRYNNYYNGYWYNGIYTLGNNATYTSGTADGTLYRSTSTGDGSNSVGGINTLSGNTATIANDDGTHSHVCDHS